MALASKESAATFPAVIALYDWLFYRGAGSPCPGPTGRGRGARCAGRLAVMQFNYADPFRDSFYHGFTLGDRLLSQARVIGYYAGLIAWPRALRD